jgi:hypothetical protein
MDNIGLTDDVGFGAEVNTLSELASLESGSFGVGAGLRRGILGGRRAAMTRFNMDWFSLFMSVHFNLFYNLK